MKQACPGPALYVMPVQIRSRIIPLNLGKDNQIIDTRKPVLGIYDILVRIRIRGSAPLINGSDSFLQRL